ncbi:hypothetical protein PUR34_19205 [Streptomyces sp. JV185]|uniref:hypothetical protein n=1 Tax=Streptomyces sp. JV185 TaxID=858638 RepID=UPI002E75C08B|nr:hypothetical protein [Streptomyces sp. JV185]MEE1770212.1 hypothetical protein [Streptomyces sp. JV185]
MRLPAEAVATTALIEVVRISALPTGRGVPYPGRTVAHWTRSEAADVLTLIESLPGGQQHRCGFSPGWSVRAYEDSLGLALFEAAFCFTCHEVRIHGPAVPSEPDTQFFDADAPSAQALLALFRAVGP